MNSTDVCRKLETARLKSGTKWPGAAAQVMGRNWGGKTRPSGPPRGAVGKARAGGKSENVSDVVVCYKHTNRCGKQN